MKLGFMRVANRLTGISTPFFGASWKPPELDVDVATELITFLEDRRMLYESHAWENAPHVVASVMETRAELTRFLTRVDRESPLGQSMRAMRAACRKFLTQSGPPGTSTRELAGGRVLWWNDVAWGYLGEPATLHEEGAELVAPQSEGDAC